MDRRINAKRSRQEARSFNIIKQIYAVKCLGIKSLNKEINHHRISEDYFVVPAHISHGFFHLNSFKRAFMLKILRDENARGTDKFEQRKMFTLINSLEIRKQKAKIYLRFSFLWGNISSLFLKKKMASKIILLLSVGIKDDV